MKIGFYITLFALLPLLSFAQAPDTVWTRTYGSGDYDFGYAVKETSDGGYILAGGYQGNQYAYIIKTNPYGDTLWSRKFGNGYDGRKFHDVVQTTDGGYACIGSGWIYQEADLWLVKMDSLGDTLWTRVYEEWWWDCGYSLQQTSDGGYITLGAVEIGGRPTYAWLIKTDTLGYPVYSTALPSNSGIEVQLTSDGGYIIAGDRSVQGGYIAKTDSQCNVEWEKWYGDDQSGIQSVCQAFNGGYMALGFTDTCLWLLHLDEMGDTLWTRKYTQDSGWSWFHDYMHSKITIRSCPGSNYVIFASIIDNHNNSDIYIFKVDQEGNIIWEKALGGSAVDLAYSIEATADSGYILAGSTESFGSGGSDLWLLKIETDSLGKQENDLKSISAYGLSPTIVRGSLPYPIHKSYVIFDITGRQIHTLDPAPGIYFIKVDGEIRRKVIKIR
jgi:hypothetical protein